MRCLHSFSRLTRSSSSLFRLAMILACGSEIVAKSKVSTCSDIVVDKQTGHGALHSFLKVLFIFGISFESQPFPHTSQIEMQQGASASRCHRPVDVRRLSNSVCKSSRTVARPPSAGSRSWVTQRVEFRAFFRFLYFAPASNEPQDRNMKTHSDWSWCTVMHGDDLESCVGLWRVLWDQFDGREHCCLECLHGTWYSQWDCGRIDAWRGEFYNWARAAYDIFIVDKFYSLVFVYIFHASFTFSYLLNKVFCCDLQVGYSRINCWQID